MLFLLFLNKIIPISGWFLVILLMFVMTDICSLIFLFVPKILLVLVQTIYLFLVRVQFVLLVQNVWFPLLKLFGWYFRWRIWSTLCFTNRLKFVLFRVSARCSTCCVVFWLCPCGCLEKTWYSVSAEVCTSCMIGRPVKSFGSPSTSITYATLQLTHADVSGPFPVPSLNSDRYFLTIVDLLIILRIWLNYIRLIKNLRLRESYRITLNVEKIVLVIAI